MLATYAAKSGFLPRMFKNRVISPIIKQPQPQENHGDKDAKDNCGCNKIHRIEGASPRAAVQTEPPGERVC